MSPSPMSGSPSVSGAAGFAMFSTSACPKDSFNSLSIIMDGNAPSFPNIPKTAKAVKRRSAMYVSAVFGKPGYEPLAG